jgi:hypothetical protein
MITPKLKEIINRIKKTKHEVSYKNSYAYTVYGDDMKTIEQALTDYEQLQRDVKRYFELDETDCDVPEVMEWRELKFKLMKVGVGE